MATTSTNHRSQSTTIDPFTELVTTQRLNHGEVLEKIAAVRLDVAEVKNGVASQLAEQNVRIIALETWRQTKAADEKLIFLETQAEWTATYRSRWKWMFGLVGLASAMLGYLIDHWQALMRMR